MIMDKPKLLYGICGIGRGHTDRQRPLVEHFAKRARMVIFGYGESLHFYSRRFEGNENVLVEPVAVPFYVGNKQGLDFEATSKAPQNQGIDFLAINSRAMAKAQDFLGKPDLVMSDYEPTAAQYAYTKASPLVTIDQQSKYLVGDFPQELNDCGYKDEVERLRLFFPQADRRIACSFFGVTKKPEIKEEVEICAPIVKDEILNMQRRPGPERSILVYLSSQQEFGQTAQEIAAICGNQREAVFHLFLPKGSPAMTTKNNVHFYSQGDPRFRDILSSCSGIVSTAGHSLLSEAMHLGVPVYAMPLPLYEQQMNAHIINSNDFGLSHPQLEEDKLTEFLRRLEDYAENIRQDTGLLLKGSNGKAIIESLEVDFL